MANEQKAVELYKTKIDELANQGKILAITSPEENAIVIEYKAKLRNLAKEIKAESEKATKPLNEALRKVREWWSPIKTSVETEENRVDLMLLAYKKQVDEEARKQEERIAARVEKGTMRLDTAEKKLDALPQVQKTTHTAIGDVQFRKVPKMRIINPDLIPDEYWVIDEVKLRKDVIADKVVPGAEKYYEETV